MLTPRYYFLNDFKQFSDYFQSQPHHRKTFRKGEYLWEPDEPYQRIHYIISGLAQCYVEHENGHRKIISFHGTGTVFPGYHENNYKIENSLITKALSDMEVLEFTKVEFRKMFESNPKLIANVIEWFSMYTNLLLYVTAHQEYNSTFIKLCNLLYLMFTNTVSSQMNTIDISQEELADILGISRVNLARNLSQLRNENIIRTHRKWIELINLDGLIPYCSLETI